MRTIHLAILMFGSAVAGMAAVVSCGDDGPSDADAAAVCDCTGFEPVLDAPRIYRVRTLSNGSTGGPTATFVSGTCEEGDVVIGGGCATILDGTSVEPATAPQVAGPDFTILASNPRRFYDTTGALTGTLESWQCVFDNRANSGGAFQYQTEATAICLDIKPDP